MPSVSGCVGCVRGKLRVWSLSAFWGNSRVVDFFSVLGCYKDMECVSVLGCVRCVECISVLGCIRVWCTVYQCAGMFEVRSVSVYRGELGVWSVSVC